ncbi:MAG: response regulator [Bacteroidales bacterium]
MKLRAEIRYLLLLSLAMQISLAALPQEREFIHYTNQDGLPYSAITDFAQDSQGFMWVAMRNSICRFDGYEFIEYETLDTAGQNVQLKVPVFLTGNNGEVFVTTTDSRLFRYIEELDKYEEVIIPGEYSAYSNILMQENGDMIFLQDGQPYVADSEFDLILPLHEVYVDSKQFIKGRNFIRIAEGRGKLAFLSSDEYLISVDQESGQAYKFAVRYSHPDNLHLFDIDSYNNLWISDAEIGLTRIVLDSGEEIKFCDDCEESRRIPHNMVRSVVYDNELNVWMGTENGIAIWSPVYDNIDYLKYDPANPDGLNSNAIYKIFSDNLGNIWVGTYFGGINIWYSGHEFFSIRSAGFGPYDLGGKEVSYITEDSNGDIWVGLEGSGVNRISSETGIVTRFVNEPGQNSLSYNNVHPVMEGPDQKIYIGTYTGGLNIYDPVTGLFSYINMDNTDILRSDNIYSLFSVGDSIIVGTDLGAVILNTKTGLLFDFHSDILKDKSIESICRWEDKILISSGDHVYIWNPLNNDLSLFSKINGSLNIIFVETDSKNNVWVGDRYKGLFYYDMERDTTMNFNPSNGFPDSMIFGIVEDEDGWYWVSSSRGLIRFNPDTLSAITYTTESGLPFNQFSYNAYYKDSKGTIYFGGINGMVSFASGYDVELPQTEDIVFTRLEIFNENIKPGDNPGYNNYINLSRKIVLAYQEKYFSVYFSALNFTHPGRIQYSYYLEGFDKEWIYAGNRNSATFTNLSPGKYKLYVRSYIDNSSWSDEEAVLNIIIKPPFLLSPMAYVLYGLILLSGLVVFYMVSSKIEKTKALALIERYEREQDKKLNQSKLEFFTNVSHELKTPLTLIIGPLTGIIRSNDLSGNIKEKLNHINDNARRLLGLINQLMEFRKTDLGKASLNIIEGDINQFSRDIKAAFDDIAEMKQIDYSLDNQTPFKPVFFDHEKLERILFNLLSNAFKYTDHGGKIVFRISVENKSCDDSGSSECLVFEVMDNGRGIASDKQNKIFERFYQYDSNSKSQVSSGIGLALVQNLVRLHKGKIELESKPGKGSLFRFWIPCLQDSYSDSELADSAGSDYKITAEEMVGLEFRTDSKKLIIDNDSDKPSILIVDDNSELLSFLSESIAEKFNVSTATNGKEALGKIHEINPDIIITDIIMPEMDGIELTKHIKTSIETSHIPVILLSAKAEVEDKYEGYLTGADSYIEKPFYPHLLLQHIENILSTRERLVSTFKNNINSRPAEIAHSKHDKDFMEKLSLLILNNIDNPDLDVSFLVSNMSVSRSLLHLKLKKIANCSATAYIRSLRLRKAAKLISEEGISFSEAAYLTGFSSPAFFSRRFKEYFGKTPSQYIEKQAIKP